MGGKQRGKRQYLYVPVACLTLLLIPGCLTFSSALSGNKGRLAPVQSALSRDDFEGAVKESQLALALSPLTSPGDEALMRLGLLSAHYANPKRDYQKALVYFQRLEKEFPESPLAEEAKIWVGVLGAFERAKQVDLYIEEKKKELSR